MITCAVIWGLGIFVGVPLIGYIIHKLTKAPL